MSHKKIAYILMASAILATGTACKTYADAQIVIDPVTQEISVVEITGSSKTGELIVVTSGNTDTGITTPAVVTWKSTSGAPEFQNALSRLYFNKITKYNTTGDFRMYDKLTREEAAKMMVQSYFALWLPEVSKNVNCTFTDAKNINPELSGYVKQACELGLMKGNKGLFLPQNSLSRPESMTILIRMFEGQSSNENKDPRRSDYYIKGKALGITSLTNSGFEQAITRYETALYLYRLQTISTDSSLKLKSQQIITSINQTGAVSTGTIDTGSESDLTQKFSAIANSISVENDPELLEAIRWMNDNGLTNFNTISTYKPFELLLREQSAKIFDIFAKVFKFSQDKLTTTTPTECKFTDLKNTDAWLITNIQNVCEMWALAGGNNLFNPKWTLTKWQFITALIRLLDGKKLDESKNPRWTNYYQTALNMGIVWPADALTFDSPITRYEVALFLYRFKVKYQLINNLNSTGVDNLIVNTVSGSVLYQTGLNASGLVINTTGFASANVFIDTNLIQNGNFELGYISFLWTTYKVVKSSTETYFNKNFVRYGDVYDMVSDKKIWTINFVVSNKYVLEWTLRINNDSYNITQLNETSIYYKVKKI